MARECTCAETTYADFLGITTRIAHPLHSCNYVKARNALIPAATAAATKKDNFGTPRFDAAVFVAEMARRWAEIRATVPR